MTEGKNRGGISVPSVLVLGGGRWARVITDVLLPLVSDDTVVQMASPSGGDDLSRWLESTGRQDRIVLVERDRALLSAGSAVIVANAARSHFESALWGLERGVPVLVEKPLALTSADASRLHEFAKGRGALLAPALVFRFSRYLESFAKVVAHRGPIERVELAWTDAAVELRHGEVKRYDPGVSVLEDCLPHVASVLDVAFGVAPALKDLTVERGGACIRLELSGSGQSYGVLLERNASSRKRILRAIGRFGTTELDFTVEPSSLCFDGVLQPETAPQGEAGPLATMIRAFLGAAAGGPVDPRLSFDVALHASALTEAAMTPYRHELATALMAGITGSDLDYAVAELLQRSARLDEEQIVRAGADLRRRLANGVAYRGWAGIEAAAAASRDLGLRGRPVH
jgi:predicted dehydrogenase